MSFTPANINAGDTSVVTISISNRDPGGDAVDLSGISFTDTLPAGVVLTNSPSPMVVGTGCVMGGVDFVAGGDWIEFTGVEVPQNGLCELQYNVTSNLGGNFTNQIALGDITSAQGISNTNVPEATLNVAATLSVSKDFAADEVSAGEETDLTITLFNPFGAAVTLDPTAALVDTFPTGLTLVGGSAGNTCGGTAVEGTSGGQATLTLQGGSIPAQSSCELTARVSASVANTYTNTIPVGALALSGDIRTNANEASDSLVVVLPEITLVKTAVINDGGDGRIDAGDTIRYTFTVTNPGSVTITDIDITDTMLDPVNPIGTIASLAPSGTDSTVSFDYTITQPDIDAGEVMNTADATGDSPGGTDDVSDTSGTETTNDTPTTTILEPEPSLALVKTAEILDGGDGRADAGDTIRYTFAVTNTGNVTLTDIDVTDVLLDAVNPIGTIASLAPGNTDSTVTFDYTITQTDIDAGGVTNTADATGDSPNGTDDVTDTSGTETTNDTFTITSIDPDATIALVKSGVVNDGGDGSIDAGDTIRYTFAVTNTGNVTLTDIDVTDTMLDAVNPIGTIATLAPGNTDSTVTFDYTITQPDIDAGSVTNTADATGDSPNGTDDVTDTSGTTVNNDDPTQTSLVQSPSLALVKSAVVSDGGDGRVDAGDTIRYTFAVTNTGNVTLTNIDVTDVLLDAVNPIGTIASLAPGATDSTVTFDYTILQSDIDAGGITNTADATGDSPSGTDDVTDTSGTATNNDDPTQTLLSQAPAVALVKSGVINDGGDGRVDAGDTIRYTFTVTNTGNVTLTNIDVTDVLLDAVNPIGTIASLAPGASDASVTFDYTILQSDIDAGGVTNTADATGDSPTGTDDVTDTSGTAINNDDPTITSITQEPDIALVKTAVINDGGDGRVNAGDTIRYTFTVSNPGNVTLSNIDVTDTLLDPVNPIGTIASLAPGGTDSSVTYDYTLLQSDIDAGNVTNTADATGDSPNGTDDVTDTSGTATDNDDPTVTTIIQVNDMSIVLSADPTLIELARVGDTITYTVVIENTGTTTLTNVAATTVGGVFSGTGTAPVLAYSSGPNPSLPGTLAPGQSVTWTATYDATLEDILTEFVDNQALATANGPIDDPSDVLSNVVQVVFTVDLIGQIEAPLKKILEDDLRETTTKQSKLFEDIATGARDRLARYSREECVVMLNDIVTENPILFDTALAIIKPESDPVLDELAQTLMTCENGAIEIQGHTDSRGSDAYNIGLSERRVNSVLAALRERDVDMSRLVGKGYGERRPIGDNATVEGRAANRRVVFRDLGEPDLAGQPCGTLDAFDVTGVAEASAEAASSNGSFGSENVNCYTGERQIVRGDFSLSREDDFGTQGMLSATLQRERIEGGNQLNGYFLGGYASRTAVSADADGHINGFGAYGGLYGARFLGENDLILDYYGAMSLGHHRFDLTFPGTAPVDIDADGHYTYLGLFGGVSISGQRQYDSFTLVPRAGVHLTHATAGDAYVEASVPGLTETARIGIDDQSGVRMVGELGFHFGHGDLSEGQLSEIDTFYSSKITPRVFCDTAFSGGGTDECGIGLTVGVKAEDFLDGSAWGMDFSIEGTETTRRGRATLYHEQSLSDNGSFRAGVDVGQDLQPNLNLSLERNF